MPAHNFLVGPEKKKKYAFHSHENYLTLGIQQGP